MLGGSPQVVERKVLTMILVRATSAVIGIAVALESLAVASQSAENVQAAGTTLLALYRSSPAVIRTLFVKKVDNQFFPLEPGTTFFYEGTKDGVPTRNETRVTAATILILNIDCTVVP
jgi:hypothetical protein